MSTSPKMIKLPAYWGAILGCAMSTTGLFACPIPITNPSFETDAITGANAPVFMTRTSAPTGWTYVAGSAPSGLLAPDAAPNTFYNTGSTQGVDGSKVYFTIDGQHLMKQVLTSTLQANTTYTVSVASGTRSGWTLFGGYSIDLGTTTGAKVLSWSAAGRNLAPLGHFATTERSFTTGPNPPGLGQPLQITIGQPATDRLSPPATNAGYTELDNIRISATPATPRAAGTPIDVFIVAGQSNAHGWGANVAQLSPDRRHYALEPARNALLAYTQRNNPDPVSCVGSFAQLRSQGSGFAANFDGFGPELSLGTELARAYDKPVAIIKYAIGGTGLSYHLRKSPLDPDPATQHYAKMMTFISNAKQQLIDQGYSPTIKAFFWLQGEGDVLLQNGASGAYGGNLKQYIIDVRADLGISDLKFFTTEINSNALKFAEPAIAPHTTNVNQGMIWVTGELSNVYYVPTTSITGISPDQVHYNANGTIDVGREWAIAYDNTLP